MTGVKAGRSAILVVAEHSLVSEAVCSALLGRGFDVSRRMLSEVVPADPDRGRTGGAGSAVPGTALLLVDLATPAGLERACVAVRCLVGPCFLLTDVAPGPAWGALLEAGAASVMASTVGLDEVVAALRGDDSAEHALTPHRRRVLQGTWEQHVTATEERESRMASLTPRERSVLEVIYRGAAVSDVAVFYRVSEATVRSQVRAVLTKLGVGTQLEAVAEYAAYLDQSGERSERSAGVGRL
ncbi:helix-turn-helix transcriptional regulator [Nocardioides marinquilinus]|uniref:helix-turn-helix transcriptional regulator n=1 Tax=Nocardioides marinquilinus TaxID=1210400 RepID=UPI0031E937F2